MENNAENFNFEWKPSGFEKIDVNTIKMAEFLLEGDLIKNIHLTEDNKLKFSYPKGLCSKNNNTAIIDS